MSQNKVGKSTSCTYCLFQTNTANIAFEKNIFNDEAHFEGAIYKDRRLTLCTVVHKRLRKCGSCNDVSRNEMCKAVSNLLFFSKVTQVKAIYSSSYFFDINQVN